MRSNVPITRLGKFFGDRDFELELEMGQEWLIGDMNFTCVLYKIDRNKIKTDFSLDKMLKKTIDLYLS